MPSKKTIGLRVSAHEEIVGLDLMEHGIETCYAGFAMETETLGGSEEEIAEVETEGLSPYQPKVDLKDAVVTEVVPGTHKMTKVSILTNMDRFEKLKKNWKRLESVE